MTEVKMSEVKQEEKFEDNSENEGIFVNYENEMEKKDGKDCSIWKIRITTFMKINKCDTVLTREKVVTDKSDWDDQDLKAINIIYSSISNK